MNGSSATSSIDLGTRSVSAPRRFARPPASRASGGMSSGGYAVIDSLLCHVMQRLPHRFAAVELRLPAQRANARGVQPHDRNIALPAAIAACVFKVRHGTNAQ